MTDNLWLWIGINACVLLMLARSAWKIDTHISLGVIVFILNAPVVASLICPRKPVRTELPAS